MYSAIFRQLEEINAILENPEIINKSILCSCNEYVKKDAYKKHLKSKKHLLYENTTNIVVKNKTEEPNYYKNWAKQKCLCECGKNVKMGNYSNHQKSATHTNALLKQTQQQNNLQY